MYSRNATSCVQTSLARIGDCNYSAAYHLLEHFYGDLKVIFTDRNSRCYITLHCVTLHLKCKKNAEALQTLYITLKQFVNYGKDAKINAILVWFRRFAGNLTTSLRLANCSMFVPRRRKTPAIAVMEWIRLDSEATVAPKQGWGRKNFRCVRICVPISIGVQSLVKITQLYRVAQKSKPPPIFQNIVGY